MTSRDANWTTVERITIERFPACWELRLRALREHPDAFGQPAGEAERLSLEEAEGQFQTFWDNGDNRTFGAFGPGGVQVGMIGVVREQRQKNAHRVSIWGVYVSPEARGRGVSGLLLDCALEYARALPGVLQVHLTVASHNLMAIRSYERTGFVRCGRLPRVDIFPDGATIDDDLMVLMLDGYPVEACGDANLPLG